MGRTDMHQNELSDTESIQLGEKALGEIEFWSEIGSHEGLKIGARKHRYAKVLSSDASGTLD